MSRTVATGFILAALSALLAGAIGPAPGTSAPGPSLSQEKARGAYAKLPLAFVPNRGQHDAQVRWAAQGAGFGFFFTKEQALLSFGKGKRGTALALRFQGASPDVRLEGARGLPGKVNYLLGRDRSKWQTKLPTYRELRYRGLWPGIDLVLRGAKGQLKYEFHVQPGARVSDIRLVYRGVNGLSLDRGGQLKIQTPIGVLSDTAPVSYQQRGAKQVPVASRYLLTGQSAYGFALGTYDADCPVVIDPGLLYSTFLGGSGDDGGNEVAVDASGSTYVTGFTESADFPTTPGAFDTSYNGGRDAFVTKLNPAGSAPLVYSTYLGGGSSDTGTGIAIDAIGNAYVAGQTLSGDFPVTPLAYDPSFNGYSDAFVTKLDATGSVIAYSTYLGGSDFDTGNGIAVDAGGSAYVGGTTDSADFPTTPAAFDTSLGGSRDGFLTKLNTAGSAPLLSSTYLGGSGREEGGVDAVAVDASESAFLTGMTDSSDFPTTPVAFDTSYNGARDAYVTKLDPTGSTLLYSTYLGGGSDDEGIDIAFDASGNAGAIGQTFSGDFPTTPGAFDTSQNGGRDAYVAKLDPTGSMLVYSTYLGGANNETGRGIKLDAMSNAYLAGGTESADFPTTPGAFDTTHNGASDVFVTKLDTAGSAPLLYSTFVGGSNNEGANSIAIDSSGAAYVTGLTFSSNYPTTPAAFDTTYNGAADAIVTKLDMAGAPGAPVTLLLTPPTATNTVGETHCVTATVRDASGNPVPGVTVRFSVPTAVATAASPSSGSDVTDANGEATFCYSAALPGLDDIHAYADTDDDDTQDAGEPFGDATKLWTLPPSTALCEVNVTQGGWIIAINGDRANFGGNARVRADGSVQGHENYQDHGPGQPRHVESIDVTAVTCSADLTMATIFGTATVDGSGMFVFRIDVSDQGEPGTSDTYGIIMSDGYLSGQQQLQGGNVQIHGS